MPGLDRLAAFLDPYLGVDAYTDDTNGVYRASEENNCPAIYT